MAFPRAAVVIGVGNVKPMEPLTAAAPLAASVRDWLVGEGYEVELLTDADEPVTADQVEGAIRQFVTEPPRYRQLLVYFIGHGLWHGRADRWLLSRAAKQSSQAINLQGAMDLARYSGISNVIFISDACRSLPANWGEANVQGVDAFPTLNGIAKLSKVDVFKATADARPAYEVDEPGGAGRTSVLSWALRRAFEAPEQDMVITVCDEDGQDVDVVPNRRLERFLQDTVDDVLAGIRPNLSQRVEAIVPSEDDVYIARVSSGPAPPPMARGAPRSAGGLVRLRRSVGQRGAGGDDALVARSALERTDDLLAAAEFGSRLPPVPQELLPVPDIGHFESQCGLTVRGAVLSEVLADGEGGTSSVELLHRGETRGAAVVRVHPSALAGSLLLRFEDDRGAVVPFICGFIAHVTVSPAGVSQVAFVPSNTSPRWQDYERNRERIDKLRAAVSEAIESNSFVVSSEVQAQKLAGAIRHLKRLDPTLGLYAAQAYAQAGLFEHVRDVARYLRQDLGVGLYDVELLGLQRGESIDGYGLAPFCPLLSQTWSLLRARGVELPDFLQQAQQYLRNALWTSFEPEGVELIAEAIKPEERGVFA